jgi:hypothetical protein
LPDRADDVPRKRWAHLLTAASIGVAALAITVTTALVAIHPPYVSLGRVVLWGSAAVLAQLVTMIAVRSITYRQTTIGSFGAGPATVRPATHGITAIGAVVGVLCLVKMLGVARDGFFGQTHAAIDQIALLWIAAILALAYVLMSEGYRTAPVTRVSPTSWLVIITALTLISSASLLGYRRWLDHPPFPPNAIHAHVSVAIVDNQHAEAAQAALGIEGIESILTYGNDRTVVGRLDYDVPMARHDGRYEVVLIDTRTNRVAPLMFTHDGGGWDGILDSVPRQYPWLSAMSAPEPDETEDRLAISVSPDRAEPIGFVAQFPGAGPIAGDRLVVAIIFVGPQEQLYWTVPVHVQEIAVTGA